MAKSKTVTKDNKASQSGAGKAKKGFNPIRFFKEVKIEAKRVTWPSRSEVTSSTIAVFIMVFIAACFLYLADQALAWGVQLIMSL